MLWKEALAYPAGQESKCPGAPPGGVPLDPIPLLSLKKQNTAFAGLSKAFWGLGRLPAASPTPRKSSEASGSPEKHHFPSSKPEVKVLSIVEASESPLEASEPSGGWGGHAWSTFRRPPDVPGDGWSGMGAVLSGPDPRRHRGQDHNWKRPLWGKVVGGVSNRGIINDSFIYCLISLCCCVLSLFLLVPS